MAQFRIIIVGGGIAGLATAVALRAPDREIIVLEASRMNREVGALLSLQPNASKIATKLGLDRFLEGKGPMQDSKFRIFNTDGVKQMEISHDPKKYGAARVVYHRVDLHEALKEAAIAPSAAGSVVQIIPSSRVASVDCDEGIVKLENGKSYQGDLVVGADGIHSVVRSAVLQDKVVEPKPTGLSAYRLLLETSELEKSKAFTSIIDPREPVTTMLLGYDKRIIMGPGRNGTLFGVVALVPDEYMHEQTSTKSWTSEGSVEKLLESFSEFPPWIRELLSTSKEAPALYQLRDTDALYTWTRGRTVLIGDAAHAMLPTQGQGASQSFEDAEGLQAFLSNISASSSEAQIQKCLHDFFETRHKRASLIQAYSRQQAKPATDKSSKVVKLNPEEFMDYNCKYDGARDWHQRQIKISESSLPAIESAMRRVAIES